MESKYLYPKEYFCRTNGELILKNNILLKEYIADKIELLIKEKKKSYIIKEIIYDIRELIEYDINNSVILGMPFSENSKKEEIQKFNIIYILGNIFSEYHTYLIKNEKDSIPIVNSYKFVINYNKLYDESLTDYFRNLLKIECDDTFNFESKRLNNSSKFEGKDLLFKELYSYDNYMYVMQEYRGINFPLACPIPENLKTTKRGQAFLASFAFPALIERYIIDKLKSYYLDIGIKEILNLKNYDDEEEKRVILQLTGIKNENGENTDVIYFQSQELNNRVIGMIKKYKVLNKKIIKIFNEDITVGKVLHNESAFVDCFKEEYYYLMEVLFIDFNIRNNTMHLNNINSNYFSIECSSILLEILWWVINNDIFKVL